MLKSARHQGYMLIVVAIVAIIMAAAGPSIHVWINNAKIRTVAESIQNGLQFTRAEAVRRNAFVSFYLTDSVGAGCNLSGSTPNWVVALTSPVGDCSVGSNVLQLYNAREGGSLVVISSPVNTITFDGLGRAVTGTTSLCAGLTSVNSGCIGPSPEQHLAVQVTSGGQVRMCSNSRPVGDPQRC